MNVALSGREFDREWEIKFQGISVLNPGKRMMEMDSPHQDVQHTQKLENSTVPIGQNRKETLEGIASVSPEFRTQNWSSSSKACNDLNTGVLSPSDDAHLTGISGGMDGRIAAKENSSENGVPNVGVHGSLDNNTDSQTKGIHRTGLFNHLKSEISVNNTSTTSIDSTAKILQEKYDSVKETSAADCGVEQDTTLVDSQ